MLADVVEAATSHAIEASGFAAPLHVFRRDLGCNGQPGAGMLAKASGRAGFHSGRCHTHAVSEERAAEGDGVVESSERTDHRPIPSSHPCPTACRSRFPRRSNRSDRIGDRALGTVKLLRTF